MGEPIKSGTVNLTRLIGVLAVQRDQARSRKKRKQLERLVSDLCVLAEAITDSESQAYEVGA